MKLSKIIGKYVIFKKSLGLQFRCEALRLKAFGRIAGNINIEKVNPQSVLTFLVGRGLVTSSWFAKFQTLSGFYRFAISRGHATSSPLPKTRPKMPDPFIPYIFTIEEIRQLLAAVDTIEKNPRSHVDAMTMYTLLLLLYGTGLRISEALSLTLAGINLRESLLTIRNSKFSKNRLVPIGPKLIKALSAYMNRRRYSRNLSLQDQVLFVTPHGSALTYQGAHRAFRQLCDVVGIRRQDGGRYHPRLHDFRHTFSSHRLTAWYREGADVQRLLPLLSTYM